MIELSARKPAERARQVAAKCASFLLIATALAGCLQAETLGTTATSSADGQDRLWINSTAAPRGHLLEAVIRVNEDSEVAAEWYPGRQDELGSRPPWSACGVTRVEERAPEGAQWSLLYGGFLAPPPFWAEDGGTLAAVSMAGTSTSLKKEPGDVSWDGWSHGIEMNGLEFPKGHLLRIQLAQDLRGPAPFDPSSVLFKSENATMEIVSKRIFPFSCGLGVESFEGSYVQAGARYPGWTHIEDAIFEARTQNGTTAVLAVSPTPVPRAGPVSVCDIAIHVNGGLLDEASAEGSSCRVHTVGPPGDVTFELRQVSAQTPSIAYWLFDGDMESVNPSLT